MTAAEHERVAIDPLADVPADVPAEGHIQEDEMPQGFPVRQLVHKGKSLHEQRFDIAKYLLYAVVGLAAALLIACIWGPADRLDTIKGLAPVLFGPLVTLFGTSVAWYYAIDKES